MESKKKTESLKKENQEQQKKNRSIKSNREVESLKTDKNPIGKGNGRKSKLVASIPQSKSENVDESISKLSKKLEEKISDQVLDTILEKGIDIIAEKIVEKLLDNDDNLLKKSIINSFKKQKTKSTGFQSKSSHEQLTQTTELNLDSNESDTRRKNPLRKCKHNFENIEKHKKKSNELNMPTIVETKVVKQSTEIIEVVDSLPLPKDFSLDYLKLLINEEAKSDKKLDNCIKDLFCQLEAFDTQIVHLDLEADSITRHLTNAAVDLRLIHIPLLYFFHYLKLKDYLSMSLENSMKNNYKTVISERMTESYVYTNELLAIYYVMLFDYRKLNSDSDPIIDPVFKMMTFLIEPLFESKLFFFSGTNSLGLFIFAILCAHKLNLPFDSRINYIEPFASVKRLLLKIESRFSYNCNPEVLQDLFNNLFTSIVINKLDSLESMQSCDLPELLYDNFLYIGEILTTLTFAFSSKAIQNYLIYTFFQIFNIINLKSPMESIGFNHIKQHFQIFPFGSELIDIHKIIKLFFMICWSKLNDRTHLKCAIDFISEFLSVPENFDPVSFMFVI